MRLLRCAALSLLFATPVLAQGIPPLPDGVVLEARESGLKYAELKAGDESVRPVLGDKVRVYYIGWTEDGTVFDERPREAGPAEFTCGGLIAGWNEALQQMSPGARWRIEVPSELGYGERGSPPKIPGGATLTFELELVGVTTAPKFVALDPDASVRTESGIRYQILAAGDGEQATADVILKLGYAIWDRDGRMLDSTFTSGGTIDGSSKDMRPPFLKEIPLLLRVGGTCLVQVTEEQSFPDGFPPPWGEIQGGITIWRLELGQVFTPLPIPDFAWPSAENAKTLESGLVYEILKEGEGEPAGPVDLVACHYAGWLESGGEPFDSSYPRGQPLQIRGVQVIRGWGEALQRMKPGAVWLIKVPSDLGYGDEGQPPVIPGGATLVFQVELVEVLERK